MSAQLDQLLLEEYELEQKELKYMEENRLEYYDPYPFQVEFHNDNHRRKGLRSWKSTGQDKMWLFSGCDGFNRIISRLVRRSQV